MVAQAINFNLTNTMIDACHRLGKSSNTYLREIIVKFVRRLDKYQLRNMRKLKREFDVR